jgi:3-dehydroquinate dehydratase / shikimate dehydrogenase
MRYIIGKALSLAHLASTTLNIKRFQVMICVSIGRTRHRMMIAEQRALAERGAKLIELRLDWLAHQPDLKRLLNDRPTPVVISCRRPQDQGKWKGSEDQRQTLLRSAIVAGVEYVDIELDIARSIRRYGTTKRIISHHDFERTPDNIEEIHEALCASDADVVKLVTMANSPTDCVRLLKLIENSKVPTVAFCMGELGVYSRVLCRRFGSPFTYATFSSERELAPGQLSFDEMQKLYRYDAISISTKLFGVLGDPVAQSLSPKLHNTAMAAAGVDGVYLPLRVPPDQFSESLDAFSDLGFTGFSVTIPHKEAILAKYPLTDDFVREIGAANTAFRDADGLWRTANTDYQAAMDALMTVYDPSESLNGKRVLLLGSGGAARAIGTGVTKAGGILVVSSRTAKRASTLAELLKCRAVTWENRGSEYADILINCTPLGMYPNMNESPYQSNWLRDEMVVFDTVYNPEQTLLIKDSLLRGCRVVSGIEMFIRQAAAQFRYFTGQEASLETLRATLRKGISVVKGDD